MQPDVKHRNKQSWAPRETSKNTLKFMFSKKATKIEKTFIVDLTSGVDSGYSREAILVIFLALIGQSG